MENKNISFLETATDDILDTIAKARRLVREYSMTDYKDFTRKRQILQELLGKIGENVSIETPFHCDHGDNIFLGDNIIIQMNCTFVDNEAIRIGNNVLIAPNVQIYTATHPVPAQERLIPDWKEKGTTFFRTCAGPVEIKDNAWIGGGTIILAGVTIGENCVIGAGSVVTHSIPDNCVAVGNPCRVIRKLDS